MKYTLFLFSLLLSCNNNSNDKIIKLSGEIENPTLNTKIIIRSSDIDRTYEGDNYEKVIEVRGDGTFNDTLSFPPKACELLYEDYNSSIELEEGADLKIHFDAKNIVKSINFKGKGYELNQFDSDKKRMLLESEEQFIEYEVKDIDSFIEHSLINKYKKLVKLYKGKLSDSLLKEKKASFNNFFTNKKLSNKYIKKLKSEKAKKLLIGKLANEFSFESNNGDMVKLSDFKGQYVFIDIWATWCAPCKVQFPYYEKIYHQFKNENISFISISIDNPSDKQKWLDVINQEKLVGVHLFENQNENSNFIKSLNSNSIPRYLIINPNGAFVNLDAPKPSKEKEIINLLNNLMR